MKEKRDEKKRKEKKKAEYRVNPSSMVVVIPIKDANRVAIPEGFVRKVCESQRQASPGQDTALVLCVITSKAVPGCIIYYRGPRYGA